MLLLLTADLFGQDLSDTYGSVIDVFGIDPNAGQNSFLILLIPSGGKYEGMGTAFTAVTLDSGFIDSNPASSSFVENSELVLMHNDWILDTDVESLVYTVRRNNLGLGFAVKFLHLPFTGYNEWGSRWQKEGDSYATGFYTETLGTLNVSYNFLKTYYFSGLGVGANLKVGYRGVSESLATGQSAVSLMGDLGLITKINVLKFYASRDKNFGIGLAVKNLGQEFIEDPDPLPSMVTAGIAYNPIRPLVIAVDFNYPFNLNGEDAEMFSVAAGINVDVTSFLSMQAGFLIKTGKPRLSIGSSLELRNVSVDINYTLDMTTQFEAFDRMSIALRLNLGDFGRALARDTVQQLYLEGLEAYADGRLREAIRIWDQCLEMDPTFTPAMEMIETSKKTLELEEEMQQRQTVEN